MDSYIASLFRGRAFYRKSRQRVIEALGGKCVSCGFSDSRALHVDHVNSDGAKRRESEGNQWSKLHKEILNGNTKDYQLLCANCNDIKRMELFETNMSPEMRQLLTKVTEMKEKERTEEKCQNSPSMEDIPQPKI